MTMQALENMIFTTIAPKTLHHVQAVKYNAAEGLVADVYEQMRRDLAVAPPFTLHSPLPQVMAGVWSILHMRHRAHNSVRCLSA